MSRDGERGVILDVLQRSLGLGLRTVRLGPPAEDALQRIVRVTGLSISGALNRGLLLLSHEVARRVTRSPFEVYEELDLGVGGYAIRPSTEARRGVRQAIARKLKRRS